MNEKAKEKGDSLRCILSTTLKAKHKMKQNYENEIPLKNKTVLITSKVEEIEIMIKNLLEDKKIQQELIKNGKRFVDEYIVNQGDSSKKLADILEDYE